MIAEPPEVLVQESPFGQCQVAGVSLATREPGEEEQSVIRGFPGSPLRETRDVHRPAGARPHHWARFLAPHAAEEYVMDHPDILLT